MISFKNVNKWYGELHVLNDINLEVDQGEVVVVCGPSGSGKSTLIRCINRLEPIQKGELIVDGMKVHDKKSNMTKIRADIGFVFQSFNLYPHMTALENTTIAPLKVKGLSKAEAEKIGRKMLIRVGLEERITHYPAQLSGGQQQRVAIARGLTMQPKIMLFDEPTSALDPEMIHEVLDVMRDLAKEGKTMMAVTHEMGFARDVASRVVFMDEGKIIEVAPPNDFFTNPQTDRGASFLKSILTH
ncbi:MAG: amino acid ABC transporter ATP-binding protein [Deltaproteobacteria bacterium]|nr:amino acid ABC transporter ATP-binding protein [Deltaproteobacteria bacterium]